MLTKKQFNKEIIRSIGKMKRIKWHHMTCNGVPQYSAYNQKKEMLGYLSYERVGKHMHWCWYQFDDIRMSPGCLQEVRDKQKELFAKRQKDYTNKMKNKCPCLKGDHLTCERCESETDCICD